MKFIFLFGWLMSAFLLKAQEQEEYILSIKGASTPLKMIPVVGGDFIMGSDKSERGYQGDESPEHSVSVEGFWMGEHEITWDQYEAFVFRDVYEDDFVPDEELEKLAIDGVSGATQPYVDMSFGMGKDGYPAINVTQYAALMYCKWLTAQTGTFYRLPTEAEWEYACKIGNPVTMDSKEINDYAVFVGNAGSKYAKIKTKKPNAFGFYDMQGNVAEWTMDQYDKDFYKKSKENNPWNVPETLYPRVARGGSWKMEKENLRCASRIASDPSWKKRDPQLPKSKWWLTNAPFMGFRIVRPMEQPEKSEIEKYWLKPINDYGN